MNERLRTPPLFLSVSFARPPRRQTEPANCRVRPRPCVLAAVHPLEAITRATSRRQLALRTRARTPSLFYQPSSGRPPCTLLTRRQLLSQHLYFPYQAHAEPHRLVSSRSRTHTCTSIHTHTLSLSLSQPIPSRSPIGRPPPRTRRA